MKKSVFISILLSIVMFSATSFAVDLTMFGPKQYVRTTGEPNEYTDTFSALPKEGKLVIKNGMEDGNNRVTSALLFLNGERLFSSDDFKQQDYLTEISVALTSNNSLSVELAGSPGSYLTIEVAQDGTQQDPPTITIGVNPGSIMAGESSTLTWATTNAESCVIEPGIGGVDLSGTLTVSPTATTTYTITATGPGGTAIDNVTVTVTYPLPAVDIAATPDNVQFGEASTLTWSSVYTNSCSIEPGIGAVDLNGSITVSPTETTIYTITASGPGGEATDDVTITVSYPQPAVSISADPENINIGNSSTITWTASYASYVSIDQGIGVVDPIGSIMVSPTETTTYTITASNPVESITETVTITVLPLNISITSPLNNDLIPRPYVMVQGVITNPLGLEVGVNVNGVIALAQDNQFVANHVPLEQGINSITASAVDSGDNHSTDSINVYADLSGDYIKLDSSIESGIAPLEALLNIEGSFNISDAEITYTGPGEVVFLENTNENEYTVSIEAEGLYFITAEVEHEGVTYSDTVAIQVPNITDVVLLLKSKWDTMSALLIAGDVEAALDYFIIITRERYNALFTDLGESNINTIFLSFSNFGIHSFSRHICHCGLIRDENGTKYSYPVTFVKDENGLWKIMGF